MYTLVNLSFTAKKMGFKRSKLYRYVFVMDFRAGASGVRATYADRQTLSLSYKEIQSNRFPFFYVFFVSKGKLYRFYW